MKKQFKALLKALPNIRLFPFLIIFMAIGLISISRSAPKAKAFNVTITHVPLVNYATPEGIYMAPESSKWEQPTSPYAYTQALTWFLHLVFASHEKDSLSFEEVETSFIREGKVLWAETFSREYLRRMEWIEGAFEQTTEYFIKYINMGEESKLATRKREEMESLEKMVPPDLPAGGTISWVRVPFACPWFAKIGRIDMRFKVRDSKGNLGELSHSIEITNYQQKTKVRLPFHGVWHVSAGNDFTTGHRRTGLNGSSTYGYDFVKVSEPEESYGYGEPILAAADGVVEYVRNDIPAVGIKRPFSEEVLRKDPDYWIDSFVVINHGNGEYSWAVHLDKGGIVVKVGDQVKAGQVIALESWSGPKPPSFHWNMMTKKPGKWWIEAKSFPALFSDFERVRAGKVSNYKIKLGNPMSQWYVRPIE